MQIYKYTNTQILTVWKCLSELGLKDAVIFYKWNTFLLCTISYVPKYKQSGLPAWAVLDHYRIYSIHAKKDEAYKRKTNWHILLKTYIVKMSGKQTVAY